MRRIMLAAIAVFGLVTLTPAEGAYACMCRLPESAHQALQGSTAAFAGRVSTVQTWFVRRHVDFHVNQVWKGDVAQSTAVWTGMGGGDCGYDFEIGRTYLVFATGGSVGTCSGTMELTSGDGDLARVLGDPGLERSKEFLAALGPGGAPTLSWGIQGPALPPWVVLATLGGLAVAMVAFSLSRRRHI